MKENEVKRLILGEFVIDEQHEAYIQCWVAYHEAANSIDGHIKTPNNLYEVKLCRYATRLGFSAMNNMKEKLQLINIDKEKWRSAKLEALRRLDGNV